ncbi:DegT/DnrJ/EryC1/StrS family aminotransferase [Neptunicella marina]|uniref:DegT/DnrJ/EryC1/StrS aminotransferase family protein n=1 Tax=Neptunicella marina TaxID=2125989 RepID=A0A8J6LXQ9_9ALTE|nr:DegT/DnrJ/EryC1/StrS family aminotransferase [Neptunicella marina]MBC3765774.1 DegT/DnrJ/EryC1/StrS aminotransferase family protein [Neptunicella marina]
MEVYFPPVIANATDFPAVTIKASPKVDFRMLRFFRKNHYSEFIRLTKNGRGALGIVGQQLKYNDRKNVILIPAYHCPALVEPFIWLNYEIRFYPLNPDLSVDIEQFNALAQDDVTHCIVVRFFGFSQNIEALKSSAKTHNLLVIEDCAHALFDILLPQSETPADSDAQIASINKLLPSIDGGVIHFPKVRLPKLPCYSLGEECKGLMHSIGLMPFINKIRQLFRRKTSEPAELFATHVKANKLKYFSPDDMTSGGYRHTQWLLDYCDINRIKVKRSENFNYLVGQLKNSTIGHPLFEQLSDNTPYVVPFLLNDKKYFTALRKQGIQVLRWEEVAKSDCRISQDYRERLVQLPCHQSLRQNDLDEIVLQIRALETH